MGKARLLGRHVKVYINAGTNTRIQVGEFDKVSVKERDELKVSQPLGDATPTSQQVPNGWELSFDGGKVDFALAAHVHSQSQQVVLGGRSPYFEVDCVHKHFNSKTEQYTYKDVTLHGYGQDMNGNMDEVTESLSGFAGYRVASSADTKAAVTSASANIDKALDAMLENTPDALASNAATEMDLTKSLFGV